MSGYIGNIPVPQATQTRQSFTATASQTTFNTAGYSVGYVDVFLNGVKLAPADYTATNGSDIILAVGAASGDILEIVAYEIFQVVDQDFTGDFTVDGTTFVVDSTNNRVGVGTSSPSTTLDLVGSWVSNTGQLSIDTPSGETYSGLAILNNGTPKGFLYHDNSAGTLDLQTFTTDALRFKTNNSERMRIGSNGTVLLGKTADNLTDAGQVFSTAGSSFTRSGGAACQFNRNTSDGEVIRLSKDGTTVGSIGNSGNDFYVTGSVSNIAGVTFANSKMMPMKSGSPADGQSDLGSSSYRWRDAYLSGGVYLGGTGAANKLDDYETGTWTPHAYGTTTGAGTTMTLSDASGSYVKVGRVVTVHAEVDVSNTNSASGNVIIGGLPFTAGNFVSPTGVEASGSVGYYSFATGVNSLCVTANENTTILDLRGLTSSTASTMGYITVSNLGTGEFRFSITYFAA